jgi:hypothetical protein
MDRRILISILVIALVICLILSCVSIAGAIFFIGDLGDRAGFADPTETAIPRLASPTPPATPGEDPARDPVSPEATPIDPATASQMDAIQVQVIQERGLEPQGDFTRVLFSPDRLRQRVLDDFLEDYTPEDAEQDVTVLAAFGLIEPGFDLHSFYIELLSEQIAGFYDNETKEMVVVQGEGFGGMERMTYAHEYVHALQDQNYDIKNGLNFSDESCEEDSERCAAIQALMEGDASLTEMNWFVSHATSQDQSDLMDFYSSFESPVFDSAPAFMAEDFIYPYDQGLIFVQYLYERGGWGAVDRAYRDLPVSTEQILHPERYPDDKPIPVALPDLLPVLGDGWEELDRNVMGEWYTMLLLGYGQEANARLSADEAAQAAAGWGGDAYVVYHQPESGAVALVLHTTWDAAAEAVEFSAAFQDYARRRFGAPSEEQPDLNTWQTDLGTHTFRLDGDQTTWIFAPDAETSTAIWQLIQTP